MDGRSLLPLMAGDTSTFPSPTRTPSWARAGRLRLPRRARPLDEVYVQYLGPRIPNTDTCEPTARDRALQPLFERPLRALATSTRPGGLEDNLKALKALTDKIGVCSGIKSRDPMPKSGVYCD